MLLGFRHPERVTEVRRFLSYRSSKGNDLLRTRSKWPGASSPPLRRCCRSWAQWPDPLLLLYSDFGEFGRRLGLNTRSKWPGSSFHPSVAAVWTGLNGRAPFSSSTRALAVLVVSWISFAKKEMQSFSSEKSHTERSHELQIPESLRGRTWVKWALPLSLFAGPVRQSSSLWVVVLLYEHHICPPLLCYCCPLGFG